MNRTLWIAIGFMALGMTLIPIGDAIAKYLSNTTDYSATFLAWARFTLGAGLLLPFAIKSRMQQRKHSHPVQHAGAHRDFYVKQSIRGLLIALTVVTIIKAVSLSPIAEVFGCFFIGPVLSVVLSVRLLGERASGAEWASVVVGFVGVLLVVQPEFLGFGSTLESESTTIVDRTGLYWALLAGLFYGLFLIATRWAAGVGAPLAQVTMQFSVAALILTPFALNDLFSIGLVSTGFLIMMSVSSVLANYFSIQALSRVKAAALAPVVYMQVVAATVLGMLVFGESLGFIAALGLAVIVLSGFFRVPVFQSSSWR